MALDLQARSMAAQVQANLDEYIETFQNGMKFVGVSSTDPLVSGATVSDYSDWAVGNIVLYNDKEYLLTASLNIAANWIQFGEENNPFSTGTGHDSAVLVATPNEADPSVERTNTVTGDFSAVLAGSRNNISATESAAAGGIIEISGGGNNFVTGYRQTLTNCENAFTNGYKNTATNSKQFIMMGRQNSITDGQNVAVFGRDNTLGATDQGVTCSSILAGRHNTLGPCEFSAIGAGQYNFCRNNGAFVSGYYLHSSKANQMTTGQFNSPDADAFFVVGSGLGESTRRNCFSAGEFVGGGVAMPFIRIGGTNLTEEKLQRLLALLPE